MLLFFLKSLYYKLFNERRGEYLMKNLEYEGSLKEDIEILGKEKFDLSKRIMRRIIAYLIVIALIIGFCRLANILFFL